MAVKYTTRPLTASGPNSIAYELSKLSYRQKRDFFAKRVHPKYPRFQYKFMSLSSEDGDKRINYLRDLLVESRFWLCSPLDFNDPFDMSAHVIFEGDTNEIRSKFKELIDSHAVGQNWQQRRALLEKFMARGRRAWLESIKRIFAERQQKTGAYCFAGDPRSILMWSHYAKNHTGICLQFEVVKDHNTFLAAIPMNYVDEHPTYNWAADSNDMYKRILLSKFSVWNYERESRIIMQEAANTYIRFLPVALVGLILGSRIDDKTVGIVESVLKERSLRGMPEVKIYQASKHPNKYELIILRKQK